MKEGIIPSCSTPGVRIIPSSMAGILTRLARKAIASHLAKITRGQIMLIDGDERHAFGEGIGTPSHATITVHDPAFYTDIAFGGIIGLARLPVKDTRIRSEGLQKFHNRRVLVFSGCNIAFTNEVEKSAYPVGEKWHLFFWHKPPFEEEPLEIREHFPSTVGQFVHAIRTSFLVLIIENYEFVPEALLDFM